MLKPSTKCVAFQCMYARPRAGGQGPATARIFQGLTNGLHYTLLMELSLDSPWSRHVQAVTIKDIAIP